MIFCWVKWECCVIFCSVICWVKLCVVKCCVKWSDVLSEEICLEISCVKWSGIMSSEVMSWLKLYCFDCSYILSIGPMMWQWKWYCFEWNVVLSELISLLNEVMCWVKLYCVLCSDVLNEVMCWVKWYYWVKCYVKWCVNWSGVLSEVTFFESSDVLIGTLLLNEVMGWQ